MDRDDAKRERYASERDMLCQRVGANLLELRGLKRTQDDIARKAKLHPTYIGYLERGKREPSMSVLLILAEIFNVSVDRILDGLPTPQERKPPSHRKTRWDGVKTRRQ